MLIDLADAPTHGPEFAEAVVRPDGVNSKELGGPDAGAFLKSFIAAP